MGFLSASRFSGKPANKAIRAAVLAAALSCTAQGPALPPAPSIHLPPAPQVNIARPQVSINGPRRVLPGVADEDKRVAVDVTQAPWRGIGRLQIDPGTRCTAFLIGPESAVTAAHCLYVMRAHRYVDPGAIHFQVGYNNGGSAGQARVTSFDIAPGFNPLDENLSAGADWAVLLLDTPLGTVDRILPLLGAQAKIGAKIALAGYGQDRAEVMLADVTCNIAGWLGDGGHRKLMRHSCEGTRGTSGAPVLEQHDGRWAVVGVEIAALMGQATGIAVPSFVIRYYLDKKL